MGPRARTSLHVKLDQELHDHYSRMIFELRLGDDRFQTNLTEVTNALFRAGPDQPDSLREAVNALRKNEASRDMLGE